MTGGRRDLWVWLESCSLLVCFLGQINSIFVPPTEGLCTAGGLPRGVRWYREEHLEFE